MCKEVIEIENASRRSSAASSSGVAHSQSDPRGKIPDPVSELGVIPLLNPVKKCA